MSLAKRNIDGGRLSIYVSPKSKIALSRNWKVHSECNPINPEEDYKTDAIASS